MVEASPSNEYAYFRSRGTSVKYKTGQIRSDDTVIIGDTRDELAEHERRRRKAVQQQNGWSFRIARRPIKYSDTVCFNFVDRRKMYSWDSLARRNTFDDSETTVSWFIVEAALFIILVLILCSLLILGHLVCRGEKLARQPYGEPCNQ